MEKKKEKGSGRYYLLLHLCMVFYSLSAVCSKMAARQDSTKGFVLWYGAVLLIMAVYALAWQQILKRLPLTVAYANRAVTLIWGMVWGSLFFGEKIRWSMVAGAAVIMFGIWLVVTSDE